jgi:uncharacterized protein YqgC (DUF456 family)
VEITVKRHHLAYAGRRIPSLFFIFLVFAILIFLGGVSLIHIVWLSVAMLAVLAIDFLLALRKALGESKSAED